MLPQDTPDDYTNCSKQCSCVFLVDVHDYQCVICGHVLSRLLSHFVLRGVQPIVSWTFSQSSHIP